MFGKSEIKVGMNKNGSLSRPKLTKSGRANRRNKDKKVIN
jgi:hypothetical protein